MKDYQGKLSKLIQVGTVLDYWEEIISEELVEIKDTVVQQHDQEWLEMVNSLPHISLHAMAEKQEGSHSRDIEWHGEHGEMGSETTSKMLQRSEQSHGQHEENDKGQKQHDATHSRQACSSSDLPVACLDNQSARDGDVSDSEVMVAKGETLTCEGRCAAMPIKIQKKVFLVDFYVIHIHSTNVVTLKKEFSDLNLEDKVVVNGRSIDVMRKGKIVEWVGRRKLVQKIQLVF